MIDFELIVPDGWILIPTVPEAARLRSRMIDDLIRHKLPDHLPRDKAGPWRKMLRRELTEATDDASRQGARSVLLPIEDFNGHKLPGSMVMTVFDSGDTEEDPERLLASILADAGPRGSYQEIGGSPAVRVWAEIESGRVGRKAPSLQVSHYVSNLDAPGTWALLTHTVLSDGDVEAEPVQAVALLFDLIVSTLRWADRADVPDEDEVLARMDALAGATDVKET